jgi:hypothetical protein
VEPSSNNKRSFFTITQEEIGGGETIHPRPKRVKIMKHRESIASTTSIHATSESPVRKEVGLSQKEEILRNFEILKANSYEEGNSFSAIQPI